MRTLPNTMGLVVACLLMSAGAAGASTLEVKVPFPFMVHGRTLPAGQYRVTEDESGMIRLNGEHGLRASAIVMTIPAGGEDPKGREPVLTFQKHETQYRLSEIWDSKTEGREVKP